MNKKPYFIHIPKTGGISVERMLQLGKVSHRSYKRDFFHIWFNKNKYFSFAIMRNPLDRYVSAFHYLQNGGRNNSDLLWRSRLHLDTICLDQFSEKMLNNRRYQNCVLKQMHFRPQHSWITTHMNSIGVNFIGVTENMSSSVKKVCAECNIQMPKLRWDNSGSEKKEFDTQLAEEVIKTFYSRDQDLWINASAKLEN